MTSEWSVPVWGAVATVGILAVLLVLVLLLALRGRRLARRRVEAAESATAELRERLEALEHGLARLGSGRPAGARPPGAARTEPEFVITSLGALEPAPERAPVPALPPRAFADAVLRDTVVNAASLVHGVRRALSPEVRHRIRFEMKRELKRTRKERRVEVREALREYRARHRADVPADVPSEVSSEMGDVA